MPRSETQCVKINRLVEEEKQCSPSLGGEAIVRGALLRSSQMEAVAGMLQVVGGEPRHSSQEESSHATNESGKTIAVRVKLRNISERGWHVHELELVEVVADHVLDLRYAKDHASEMEHCVERETTEMDQICICQFLSHLYAWLKGENTQLRVSPKLTGGVFCGFFKPRICLHRSFQTDASYSLRRLQVGVGVLVGVGGVTTVRVGGILVREGSSERERSLRVGVATEGRDWCEQQLRRDLEIDLKKNAETSRQDWKLQRVKINRPMEEEKQRSSSLGGEVAARGASLHSSRMEVVAGMPQVAGGEPRHSNQEESNHAMNESGRTIAV
eukprot:Gb_31283 [translate_table: standard]